MQNFGLIPHPLVLPRVELDYFVEYMSKKCDGVTSQSYHVDDDNLILEYETFNELIKAYYDPIDDYDYHVHLEREEVIHRSRS